MVDIWWLNFQIEENMRWRPEPEPNQSSNETTLESQITGNLKNTDVGHDRIVQMMADGRGSFPRAIELLTRRAISAEERRD